MSPEECAYAAGLLDGEGTVRLIGFNKIRKGYTRPYRVIELRVSIANTYFPVIQWLKDRWGGRIYSNGQVRPKWKPAAVWQISSRAAVPFLNDVLPFVLIKRPHVENALAFQATRRRASGEPRPFFTSEQWAIAEGQLQRSKELNMKGVTRG